MTEECGAYGPPNGWRCREPEGHAGTHVYRPSDEEMERPLTNCNNFSFDPREFSAPVYAYGPEHSTVQHLIAVDNSHTIYPGHPLGEYREDCPLCRDPGGAFFTGTNRMT